MTRLCGLAVLDTGCADLIVAVVEDLGRNWQRWLCDLFAGQIRHSAEAFTVAGNLLTDALLNCHRKRVVCCQKQSHIQTAQNTNEKL